MERPDEWLRFGNPWEIARPEYTIPIQFFGKVEVDGWKNTQVIKEAVQFLIVELTIVCFVGCHGDGVRLPGSRVS